MPARQSAGHAQLVDGLHTPVLLALALAELGMPPRSSSTGLAGHALERGSGQSLSGAERLVFFGARPHTGVKHATGDGVPAPRTTREHRSLWRVWKQPRQGGTHTSTRNVMTPVIQNENARSGTKFRSGTATITVNGRSSVGDVMASVDTNLPPHTQASRSVTPRCVGRTRHTHQRGVRTAQGSHHQRTPCSCCRTCTRQEGWRTWRVSWR